MEDKFVLKRKTVSASEAKYPHVRLSSKAYAALVSWANATGLSLSALTTKAVLFCDERAVYNENEPGSNTY